MFDVFRLPTPAILAAPADGERAGRDGGAFVVGMLSGLVIGPCTAPVLGGLLLYVGASGHPVFGATLLFTFALGWASRRRPRTFAGLLTNLPKAGAWTVKVQRAFGILLLLAGEYLLLEAGKRLV